MASFVGIDISKDRLDVHVHPGGEAFVVARDGKGLEELIDRLRAIGAVLIGAEATGGFETIVAAAIGGAGLPFVVINPAQMESIGAALGRFRETGKPIFAQFSSSSGGWTYAGSQPYLVTKRDPWSQWSGNPNTSWSVTLTDDQLEQAFPGIGDFQELVVTAEPGSERPHTEHQRILPAGAVSKNLRNRHATSGARATLIGAGV